MERTQRYRHLTTGHESTIPLRPRLRPYAFILLWTVLVPAHAIADPVPVELTMPNQRIGTANYWQGEKHLPPLLIAHGFLLTNEFATVSRLAEALADDGYTVLAPTLTLGISRRKQNLSCEAIHTHSMHSDVEEIRTWAQWLLTRNGRSPILIGHSAAGVQLLAYLSKYPDAMIHAAVLISLVGFGPGPAAHETPSEAALAHRSLDAGRPGLGNYALAYCERYVTDAASFLSYYAWSREKTAAAAKLAQVPITVIFGGSDSRIDAQWLARLNASSIDLVSISGANHFFDQEHEFDLLEVIEGILSDLSD